VTQIGPNTRATLTTLALLDGSGRDRRDFFGNWQAFCATCTRAGCQRRQALYTAMFGNARTRDELRLLAGGAPDTELAQGQCGESVASVPIVLRNPDDATAGLKKIECRTSADSRGTPQRLVLRARDSGVIRTFRSHRAQIPTLNRVAPKGSPPFRPEPVESLAQMRKPSEHFVARYDSDTSARI